MVLKDETQAIHRRAERNGSSAAHSGAWQRNDTTLHHDASKETAVWAPSTLYLMAPTLILVICPAFAMLMSYTIVKKDGSPYAIFNEIRQQGFLSTLYNAWMPYVFGSAAAWKLILPFIAFELLLMRIVPGKRVEGPVTPAGNIPIYKANGMLAYLVTLVTFFVCAYVLKLFDPAEIYDHFLEIIGAMNIFSFLFCLGIYLKGRYYPSSSDCGNTGNLLFDYYWGTELYPRVFGWDVKMFTNCRFGLMGWSLLIISYAAKQYEVYGTVSDSMLVSVGLQLVYITKFFHWEMGYMKSLDIMHDRAGYMLCWGCMVWVPSVYTSHTLYLTTHPNHLGLPLAILIFIVGVLAIFFNYEADRQREMTRNTNGNCTIWGNKPDIIRATYYTSEGEQKNTLLLLSGWWGVSRHFHYIPELLAALCWSLPALFVSFTPYFYFFFLCVLLTHRAIRDDKRCAQKYGKYWEKYCEKVPYKMLPLIY